MIFTKVKYFAGCYIQAYLNKRSTSRCHNRSELWSDLGCQNVFFSLLWAPIKDIPKKMAVVYGDR